MWWFPILARVATRAAGIGFVALAAAALAGQQSQQPAADQTQQAAAPATEAQPQPAKPKSALDSILEQLKQPQPSQPGAAAEPQQAKPKLSMDEILSRLPQRVRSKDGKPGDMVNFVLVGSQEQVEGAMKAAGWVTVDRSVEDAITHALDDVLQHQAYNAMPMSQLFLFGRPQDLGYASGIPLEVMQNRDHCRLWQAPWLTPEGQSVWVGAGTHDTNFERDPAGKVTHSIDSNVDRERDNIVQSLQGAAQVKNLRYFTPGKPLREGLTATGEKFTSDGRVVIIFLK